MTVSEVAQMKLNADWVVLSACNTAGHGGSSRQSGITGLAGAFLFAGARSLLVSHWTVLSDASTELVSRTLVNSLRGKAGGAEAHRQAIVAMLSGETTAHFKHPLSWGAFSVIGDGGTYRPQKAKAIREKSTPKQCQWRKSR